MKALFFILSLFISVCSLAQTVPDYEPDSFTAKLVQDKGAFVKKEVFLTKIFDTNSINSQIHVDVAIITNMRTEKRTPCLIVRVFDNLVQYYSYIDYDEIKPFIDALGSILSIIEGKPAVYTELTLVTRDLIKVNARPDGNDWVIRISFEKFISVPTGTMSIKRLKKLIDGFNESKTRLDEVIQEQGISVELL